MKTPRKVKAREVSVWYGYAMTNTIYASMRIRQDEHTRRSGQVSEDGRVSFWILKRDADAVGLHDKTYFTYEGEAGPVPQFRFRIGAPKRDRKSMSCR